jgi:hypothetical protein
MKLLGDRFVIGALTVREIAGMSELSLFVALDAMNGFTVSAAARLFFLWVRHVDRFEHSTKRIGKKGEKIC